MKGIVINQYGNSEELNLQVLTEPVLGPKDLLIEVHAAAVNPVDVAIRKGYLNSRIQYELPLTIGWDVAGIVREVGYNVKNFKRGDEVYSYSDLSRNGTYAELVAVDEKYVANKPKNLSMIEAASLPLVSICAYRSLVKIGNIQQGQKVLILGGSGGVGSVAVQLAKALGAYVVATTSLKNLEFVKNLGADEVIDYTSNNYNNVQRDFDLIFDTVGRNALELVFDHVKTNGKIISIATFFTEKDHIRAEKKKISINLLISEPSGDILSKLTSLVNLGKVKPVVSEIFPLGRAREAHNLIETRHVKGKIVLKIK